MLDCGYRWIGPADGRAVETDNERASWHRCRTIGTDAFRESRSRSRATAVAGCDVDDDPLLVATWHDLSHFSADDDIRRKDRNYAEYQTELLSRRGHEIRTKCGLGTG